MNIYKCYMKSYCDAPDFELEIIAENIEEAVQKLKKNWLADFDVDFIKAHIEEAKYNEIL